MRDIRNRDGTIFRLVTIRTVRGELWLAPNKRNERLIGGIIARYQEIFKIEIYTLTVLGNHYHILCRAPEGNLDEFEENVNREISRRINWRYRREGSLWGRRYDDEEVLRDADLKEAFLYVTTNPVRHGLTSRSADWPGLNAVGQLLSGKKRKFSFHHYSAAEDEEKSTTHCLTLSVLPDFEEMSPGKRKRHVAALIKQREEDIARERRENGQGFCSAEFIRNQEPGALPQNVSKSPRPACYSKCARAIKEFLEARRLRRDRYNEASRRFRMGDLSTEFPEHTFRPPLHRKPRTRPFVECSEEDFSKAA